MTQKNALLTQTVRQPNMSRNRITRLEPPNQNHAGGLGLSVCRATFAAYTNRSTASRGVSVVLP